MTISRENDGVMRLEGVGFFPHLSRKFSFFFATCAAFLFLSAPSRADEATVALSSLDLTKATQGWGKPGVDRSVDGHPLTLHGQTFPQGFGTHSPGILAIQTNSSVTRFTATVGIDDEVGNGRGSAEFMVLDGDKKVLYRSGILHQGMEPKKVDVDLTGKKHVILRVTDGGDGYEFDHADWAEATFTVKGMARPAAITLPPSVEPTIAMTAPDVPQINGPHRIAFRTGMPLSWTLPVSGIRPLHYDRPSDLPAGLTFDSTTGTVTGTLKHSGDYDMLFRVKNAQGSAGARIQFVAGEKIALTPPMGWNSYDAFGDAVDESQAMANATYLHEKMQPFGWDTVVIDYRWYDPEPKTHPDNGAPGETLTMDANGRLLPSPNRFPSAADGKGFRGLADTLHAMGLKFGIHIMRGIPRNAVAQNLPIEGSTFHAADAANPDDKCPWCPDMFGVRGATPAGRAYYDSLFRLYAAWGVDFVKMDDTSAPYHTDEIDAVRAAIDKTGRPILYSLSPGETPLADAAHVTTHANMWRESGDFWDNWSALSHEFVLANDWQPYAAPGHWPDADMLPLGHLSVADRPVGKNRRTNFTHAEQMTLLSLWCLLPSPLMVGANLPDNDPWTLALLTNPEVLDLDQDASGNAAKRVVSRDEMEAWTKTLDGGSIAVGLFNRSDLESPFTVTAAELGVPANLWSVRDLWMRTERGTLKDTLTVTLPPHGAALFRLNPPPPFLVK